MFDLECTFISRKSKDCGKPEQNILTDGDGSSEDKHNVVGSARSLACPSPPSGASFSQQLKSKRRISKALRTKVSGTKKIALHLLGCPAEQIFGLASRVRSRKDDCGCLGVAVETRQPSAEHRSRLGGFVAVINGTCVPLKLIKNVLWSVHGHFLTHIFHSDGIRDQPQRRDPVQRDYPHRLS